MRGGSMVVDRARSSWGDFKGSKSAEFDGAAGAGLARATGTGVASATAGIGGAALGGVWELATRSGEAVAQPPLTAAGMVSYAGVLPAFEITITGTLPKGNTTGTVTYFVVDTTR